MNEPGNPAELIDFPCHYTFKALGVSGESFSMEISAAAREYTQVSQDAVHIRPSGKGKYQAVSLVVWLENYQQLTDIYARMKMVTGLKMLL